eukprot:TRINITY_DN15029_c0_g1_i1.p4 TRINITY_DN15029_c0_g1~~TRINITY_DN15029_c0_g1_i1.p4  ORF type:complete len:248 (+),score=-24.67 TRINITY_DN15029_c0_g1_i1:361-1104(+)
MYKNIIQVYRYKRIKVLRYQVRRKVQYKYTSISVNMYQGIIQAYISILYVLSIQAQRYYTQVYRCKGIMQVYRYSSIIQAYRYKGIKVYVYQVSTQVERYNNYTDVTVLYKFTRYCLSIPVFRYCISIHKYTCKKYVQTQRAIHTYLYRYKSIKVQFRQNASIHRYTCIKYVQVYMYKVCTKELYIDIIQVYKHASTNAQNYHTSIQFYGTKRPPYEACDGGEGGKTFLKTNSNLYTQSAIKQSFKS